MLPAEAVTGDLTRCLASGEMGGRLSDGELFGARDDRRAGDGEQAFTGRSGEVKRCALCGPICEWTSCSIAGFGGVPLLTVMRATGDTPGAVANS